MDTMKYLMRYNDYKNDPYSANDPMNTICSRGDLKKTPEAEGCYDTKVYVVVLFANICVCFYMYACTR